MGERSQQLKKLVEAAGCSLIRRSKCRRRSSSGQQQQNKLESWQDVSSGKAMDKEEKWGKLVERRGVSTVVVCTPDRT